MFMDTIRDTAQHVTQRSGDASGLSSIQSPDRDAQGRSNLKKRGPKRKGRYVGICYVRKARKWAGFIVIQGKQKYLGLHDKPETAARVYDSWSRRIHGAKATLNFPKEHPNGNA